MRLSKQQINALAEELASKINKKVENEYIAKLDAYRKDPINIVYASNCWKLLSQLPDFLIKEHYMPKSEKDVLEKFVNNSGIKREGQVSTWEMEHKIILASIDAESMDELLKKLNLDIKL